MTIGGMIVHFQSPANDFLRLSWIAFQIKEIADSKRRPGVSPTAQINGLLKRLHGLRMVTEPQLRNTRVVVRLVVLRIRCGGFPEMGQAASREATAAYPESHRSGSGVLRGALPRGNPQFVYRNGVPVWANSRPRERFEVKHKLRGRAIQLRAAPRGVVPCFINHDFVRAGRKVLKSKVALKVRQNAAKYPGHMRFQAHGHLARRPLVRVQEHRSGNLSSHTRKVGDLRARYRRPGDYCEAQEELR